MSDKRGVGWLAKPLRRVGRPLIDRLYEAEIVGSEHIPSDGPAIISPNHLSFFDTPLVMLSAPRRVLFLGKAEYMDSWKTKYLFPAVGMVPIRREKARASMAALDTAAALLDDGELVGIYPEGTRSRDGCLHKGHTGVAHLALQTGAPIIPVGLVGTDEVQPIGRNVPRRRGKITVRFGEPIDPRAYLGGGKRRRRQQMTDDVMASIATMTPQDRSDEYASSEPPLIRGGSESVYMVRRYRSAGASFADSARRSVDEACSRYDDARVGQVGAMRCVVRGESVEFVTELAVSTRFRGGT
ncbi:MAG: lysophospholipid acyltransferase family protein [Acidimicrobiales bacterium]|nr:lysophospholipid acyltransferase family protein [Acidimicrobiales bacterium]